jgi:type I restriction enzyme, S subunit
MSFPRYPEYKDSGVEWLGEAPEHWEVKRLKYLGEAITGLTYSPADIVDDDTIGRLVLRSSNVQSGVVTYDDNVYVSAAIPKQLVTQVGDILICSRNGSRALIGKNATIDEKSAGLTFGAFMTVFRSTHSAYLSCILNSPLFEFQAGAFMTSTINQLTIGVLNNFEVPFPPETERTKIAAFLDRETAKIDALVAEQRRLMELLKEKRQAVISHAVTRGLNPDAPMKPSGIEWLGDVPEHWEVMQLKRDLEFLTSGSRGWAENYSDEGELFIRITNLTRGTIALNLADIKRVAVPEGTEGSRTKVRPDDILFSITAYLGSIAVVHSNLESAYVSQHIALARLRKAHLTSKWVGYVALSVIGQTWFDTKSYGGTKIQLSLDDVKELPVPTPPTYEQQGIVNYIEIESAKFDVLTIEAQRAIDLLQERRTALISATVTGQIDVRNVATT